jgi:hypothetical protein
MTINELVERFARLHKLDLDSTNVLYEVDDNGNTTDIYDIEIINDDIVLK